MNQTWIGSILFVISISVFQQIFGGTSGFFGAHQPLPTDSDSMEKHRPLEGSVKKPIHNISQPQTSYNDQSRSIPVGNPAASWSGAAAAPFQDGELQIEMDSTIASDIVRIWHDADSREICVALKYDARCPHPALLGRLSGPALAMLEWKERHPSTSGMEDTGTVLCGGYGNQWLDAGYYFVEIIILHCNDFGANALVRTNDTTAWMEADNAENCVEDAKRNRITSKEGQTIIHIPTSIEGSGSYSRGRWIRRHHLPLRALFTRYQPVECRGGKLGGEHLGKHNPLTKYCSSITARDVSKKKGKFVGLHEYEFQWNMKGGSQNDLVEKFRQRRRENDIPKICAIGDSHSRYMVTRTLPKLNLTGLFTYINSPWIAPGGIAGRIKGHNCDVFFIQCGQYPASFMTSGHPFPFGKYHNRLKQHVQNILKVNPNAMIYLPTVDQAPLMARINQCEDWRTPTMMNGYSHLNQMIVKELNTTQVQYIDTNFIVYSHWDGRPDWQHLMEPVRTPKTVYMTAIMLGETEWFQ